MKRGTKKALRRQLAEAEERRDQWAAEYTKIRDTLRRLQREFEKALREIEQ